MKFIFIFSIMCITLNYHLTTAKSTDFTNNRNNGYISSEQARCKLIFEKIILYYFLSFIFFP